MEASRGPQPSVSHLKGATLPGYRVGPFRSSSQASSIARRSSDGDVAESKLVRGDKCRKYEPRFWVSYKSESPSGESGTITSEPKEPSSSWESPDLAPQFSSRPTITPLAAPASPRPQVRRSFNTFPRPWKARSRSPSPFRTKEQMNKSSSDTLHFRSFNDSLNLAKYPSGAKREDEVNKYKGGQQVENISRSSEMAVIRPVPFYAKPHPHERDGTENPIPNVYRSVATITVTKSPQSPTSPPPNLPLQHPNEKYSFIHTHIREENPTRKLTSLLNSLTSRRLANKESRAEAKLVADEAKEKKLVESLYEVISEAKEKEREKRQEQQQKLMPHAPSQPPQATKISSSASLLPCVPDEHGSAPLPCDEENCALHRVSERASRQSAFDKEEFDDAQLVHDLRSNEVINTEEDSHFEKASVSSGGSGPGDREAPLSGLNAQSLMQASGRKSVRKKPQIPDKLSRRRCSEDGDQRNEVELVAGSLLSPSHSFSSADTYRAKEISPASTLQPVKSHSIPPTRTSTADKHELTKSRTTVSQILSTLNFARFRLEELTGALGGTKKNGGKGSLSPGGRSPPPKPLRMRHDLEKLKKSTERLKKSGTSDYETDSSVKDSLSQPTKPKIRGKSETSSKHIFFPKQAIARTNSSPAGVSRVSSSSLLSSLSGKLLNNENKNGDSFSSSTSSNFMLPPLPKQKPSPESRNISCSSSVSHADLSKEKDNGEASSTLKLYSTCQEPWGYHTLPRCRTSIRNTITASQDLGQNQEQIPYVSSLHDFGKLNLECSEGKENLIAKSKCEMAFQYPQNDVADLALQLSSVPKLAAESKGELESNITFSQAIEEGSIIKRLLQSDFSGHGNDSAVVCFPEAVEENNQQSRGRTLPLELNRMKLNFDVISNHEENSSHDVMKSNQFDECISDVIFEKELFEKNSNSEYIRPYKDISVQTDKNLTKEMDKYKKSRLKENRARSVDDKREKLRLWIENKSFDSGIPDNENCPKLEDTPNLPDLKYRSDDNRTKDVVTEINIVHCGADNGHQKSQSFGMPSSNFDELKAGEEINRGHEPSAISNKSGEVQMHQRVSLEDSEGESQDKEHKLFSSRSEGSDEQEPIEGIFCNPPTEFSDSSPQHNFGVHFNKTRSVKLQHPLQEASKYEERAEKSDSRKRKNHPDEGFEEDPTKRDESPCEDSPSSKTTKHMKKQENLRKFNWHCDQQRSMKNDLSLSDGDSRPNSYSEPESLQLVVTSDPNTEKRDTKKKNRSDPGFKRVRAEDIVGYFSDSNLEAFEGGKMRANDDEKSQLSRSAGPGYRVVSQASTDSEGRDELGASKGTVHDLFRHSRSQTPRFSNPPVIMSGESDASCQDISSIEYSGNRNISRNASPSPYLGDSDSGERCFVRSPHTPRRYSKRPLRGPYGEMLEAEMSKSKSTSQFLSDDLFLRPRECNSTSPRPSSPASPSAASAKIHDPFETSPPLFLANVNSPSRSPTHSTSRSLDDSTLKLFYSDIAGKKGDHLTRPENVAYPSYESDGEVGLTTLPTGPLHQRTASSPSKLFFEPVSITKKERNLSTFPAARIPPKPRSQTPPNEEKTKVARTASSETSPKPKAKLPKSKPDRHSKSTKGKKHPEEETRVHFSSQQPPKKGPHETEFRPHGDHRHLHRRYRDTRAHIIGEIYDTEKNYVDNLNFLLTRYEHPLRNPDYNAIVDSSLVDDIFFQVPEIHAHHKRLLDELKRRLDSRNASICVGDVLLQMLKDPTVAASYKSFVNNWKTAQEAAKTSSQAKPAFRHFLCAMAKEHPGKLDLKALLITPVQRFPHYELIFKRLLDHTSLEHPDHNLVKEAIVEVQKVAASINEIEQEALQQEQQQFILKEIENFIEGLVGLVQPDRTFLQLDLVTQNSGIGNRKERCLFLFSDILVITTIKRRSATIRKSASLQLPLLSSLESCKLKLLKFISLDDLEIGRSRDDSMKKLVKELESLEQDLQTVAQISLLVKALHFPKANLEESLHDLNTSLRKQLVDRQGADSQLSELELNITTQEGIETFTFMFSNTDKRNKWEEGFNAAKQKLAMSVDRRPPPEFMTLLPIRKTRAGLQFTCAAPTLGSNTHNLRDVWVCNSDGYVGQVCVMSLQPDPTLACCNGVCNAKILSIASIPAAPHPDTSDEDEDEEASLEEDVHKRRSESLPPEINIDENDNQQPTMWLGTEDGSIHVYNCNDTIRTKKNKLKFQPGSPVHCIIHIENRVFASLANGDVVVYERDAQGGWNDGERHMVNLSTAAAPVTRMVMAAGKLWCSATNNIRILNISTLQVEHSLTVGGESSKGVACMVCAGHGVWIAVHHSAVVRLYHATTHECICEVNITSPVTKMLAGCDDIIRQHKLACLKVTALLACKDLLWVGTSAGVIITLPLPHLSHNTRRLQSPLNINMVGIPHGHTGNVRFLTSVEMTPELQPSRLKGRSRYSLKGKDHPHHQSGTAAPSKLLVISGGDGYEDFRNSGVSELAGRDDSTNHLLLWQV